MKVSLSLTFFILTFCCAVISHAAQSIAVSRPNYDFGNIPQGQRMEHVFLIKNKGDMPLTIKAVRPSCGCTAAQASARVVQPGQASEIKTTFNSANFSGVIHKTIMVETDDPKAPVTILSLNGSVSEEIVVNPRQINFGVLKPGITKAIAISVGNNGKQPVKVLSVKSHMPQINVKLNNGVIKPGKHATITVSALPHNTDHMLSGYISIMTDSPARAEIIVPVFATVTK